MSYNSEHVDLTSKRRWGINERIIYDVLDDPKLDINCFKDLEDYVDYQLQNNGDEFREKYGISSSVKKLNHLKVKFEHCAIFALFNIDANKLFYKLKTDPEFRKQLQSL